METPRNHDRHNPDGADRLPAEAEMPAGTVRTLALPGGATMEMVWCPPGTFWMGSLEGEEGRREDELRHRVTLTRGFWMAKTPVTQTQWESVMGTTARQLRDREAEDDLYWKCPMRREWENHPVLREKVRQLREEAYAGWPMGSEGDDFPMYYVNWDDAVEFCRKAGNGLRLPTEAEWEYACRAGSERNCCWGDVLNGSRANCNTDLEGGSLETGPYKGETTPVGSYDPNAWGLFDCHGNVSEWCADWAGAYKGGNETDPVGPESGTERILRGGDWEGNQELCFSRTRGSWEPAKRSFAVGFRPCCFAGPP